MEAEPILPPKGAFETLTEAGKAMVKFATGLMPSSEPEGGGGPMLDRELYEQQVFELGE